MTDKGMSFPSSMFSFIKLKKKMIKMIESERIENDYTFL